MNGNGMNNMNNMGNMNNMNNNNKNFNQALLNNQMNMLNHGKLYQNNQMNNNQNNFNQNINQNNMNMQNNDNNLNMMNPNMGMIQGKMNNQKINKMNNNQMNNQMNNNNYKKMKITNFKRKRHQPNLELSIASFIIQESQSIDKNEANLIKNIIQVSYSNTNKNEYLSEIITERIRRKLGGEWFIYICEQSQNTSFSISTVSDSDFLIIKLGTSLFKIAKIK